MLNFELLKMNLIFINSKLKTKNSKMEQASGLDF